MRCLTILVILCGIFWPLPMAQARTAPMPHQDETHQILVLLRQPRPHLRPDADYAGSYGDPISRTARMRIGKRIARDHRLTLIGEWPMPLLGIDCLIMAIPDERTPDLAAAEVTHDRDVEWSQPMHRYRTQAGGVETAPVYNDPLFAAEPAARQWHLAALHELATGRGVTVAVIDTRVDAAHPDLAGQIVKSENFVEGHPAGAETHGTNVAGIIAAKGENAVGIVGIAPHARLMALRACWQVAVGGGSVCDSLTLAKALHFAIEHGVQVINMSLSGPPDLLLSRLLDVGLRRGISIVAAFDRAAPDGGFPASHAGVIAVADTLIASPSGVYMAPGNDVPTTEPGGRWYLVSGSSFATAHVSGLIALMRERQTVTGASLALISQRADGGAIDAWATLRRPSPGCAISCLRREPRGRPS